MHRDEDTVCVVIAAMNAEGTIGRAVRSALREDEVSEVVVVDDASSDATAEAAEATGEGSPRLTVIRLSENVGPSAARNRAIAASTAPLIAILDADDFLLPGRFAPMLADGDFDFVADNILFVDAADPGLADIRASRFEPQPSLLTLEAFVAGNISKRGKPRGEIGFLKPVMRRAFLDRHGLRYREEMRLGEDYDLYARALVRGARYRVIRHCGYGAVIRGDSLSVRHRTNDLRELYEADRAMLADPTLTGEARSLVARHEAHVRGRYELRRFLDEKRDKGLLGAGMASLRRPATLPAIALGVAADKLEAFRARPAERGAPKRIAPPRYLMDGRPLA